MQELRKALVEAINEIERVHGDKIEYGAGVVYKAYKRGIEAIDNGEPIEKIHVGNWHRPYVDSNGYKDSVIPYMDKVVLLKEEFTKKYAE